MHAPRLAALAGAATLAGTSAPAQSPSPLPPRTIAAIDSIFVPYAHSGSPGCAVGVYRDGRMVFARGYGFANLNHDIPITPTTKFTTGSVSKQFTAASIALLARAGRLSLDDDIRKFLPELPDYGTPVRVRHLVHHTSGLRDFWELVVLAGMRPDDGYTPGDMLAFAARQQGLNFAPGSEYRYSNTGYLAMAAIVQKVTGQSLRRFADSAIFAPLGMRETFFLDDHNEIVPGRATAYSPTRDGWRIDVWNNDIVGQGGIVTTLADLQQWDENFYTGGLGGRDFLDLMHQVEPLTGGKPNAYAFGIVHETYRGRKVVQHTGSTGGYRAALYRFPELHTSVATLCNAANANTTALSFRMADAVLGDALGARESRQQPAVLPPHLNPGAARPAERGAVAGRYTSAELNDAVWEIVAEGDSGSLKLLRPRASAVSLVPGDSALVYLEPTGLIGLRFDPPRKGVAPGFRLDGSRVSKIRFTRVTR